MTYEEKLEKIVSRLKDERDLTRKGHKTKVNFDDKSFTKVRIGEIYKILLKLQDEESIVKIIDAFQPTETVSTEQIISPNDNDDYEGVEIIDVEIDEGFDAWYEKQLMERKTSLENLDFINLLRIYDTVQDINEQVQLTHKTTVYINLLPSLIRYRVLFPADTIGFRDEYCGHRLDSLKYLKEKSIITDYSHGRDGWDTIITVSFALSKFDEFYKTILEEYKKHNKSDNKASNSKDTTTENKQSIPWPDNFVWKGKDFVFGEYGSLSLNSEDRKHILKVLTEKKGEWATVSEMKGKKDANYVRSTIKQIEDRLPDKVKSHISIVSTQDDDSAKTGVGAYRIKLLP